MTFNEYRQIKRNTMIGNIARVGTVLVTTLLLVALASLTACGTTSQYRAPANTQQHWSAAWGSN